LVGSNTSICKGPNETRALHKKTKRDHRRIQEPTLKFSLILSSTEPDVLTKLAEVRTVEHPLNLMKKPVHAENLISPAHIILIIS
jgi:hypothetical protein